MTLAVFAGFLIDWLAVAFQWKRIKPFSKVLAMILVILWTINSAAQVRNPLIVLLFMAQLFGLLGDILLLLSERWFLAGLGAFLIGHFFYSALIILSFFSSSTVPGGGSLLVAGLVSAGVWAVILWVIYRIFKREFFLGHSHGELLWTLVQAYIWVLSGLTALTIFRNLLQVGGGVNNWFLASGGILFLMSDTILAYDRFVKKLPMGQLWVHVTYHLAQFGLAAGVLLLQSYL